MVRKGSSMSCTYDGWATILSRQFAIAGLDLDVMGSSRSLMI